MRFAKFIIAILLLGGNATAQSVASSQTARSGDSGRTITLDVTNATLSHVLAEIQRQSGVKLTYSADVVPLNAKVSAHVSALGVEEALGVVLQGMSIEAHPASRGRIGLVKSRFSHLTPAQGIVMGRVTDAKSGKGLSGASVSIGGSSRVIMTGEDGSYKVAGVAPGTHLVSVKLLGFAKQVRQVTVGEGATISVDFKLDPSASILNEVVVTGTIVATELKAVPSAITVVTAKQIEERGITRIDQLFRGDVPGLFSLNLGSRSPLDEVTLFSRGATALVSAIDGGSAGTALGTNPIKTYLDGIELSDSKYISQIDPSSIERIEILTGPQASTIYGSNAINGVIQIFTKRGTANKPQLTLNFTSGFAENKYNSSVAPSHVTDANIAGIEGKISYNVGGSWDYTGYWSPAKQTQRLSAQGGTRVDMGKASADLSARQGLTKNRENGSLLQNVTYLRTSGVGTLHGSQGVPEPRMQTLNGRTYSFSLTYYPVSWWSHEVGLGSDALVAETMETAPGFSSNLDGADTALFLQSSNSIRRSERYNSTVQVPISSLARLTLALGADHWRSYGSSWEASPLSLTGTITNVRNLTRNKPSKNSGAFVQGQLGLSDRLFFTYGVRADWNPNFGKDADVKPGRYGVSYTQDIGTLTAKLRGSYGRSIRPPSPGRSLGIFETYEPYIAQFGRFESVKSNPDLGPEYQQGFEGGMELYLGNRGSLVVTRFNQTVDNLISFVTRVDSVPSLLPVFPNVDNCDLNSSFEFVFDDEGHCFKYQPQFLNVGSIRNQGWELQGSVNLGPWTTRGTYSWVKSRVLGITPRYRSVLQATNPAFQPGRPFDYVPEHTWAIGITYAQSRNTVSLSMNGVGMRYVNSNFLSLNATAFPARFHFTRLRMDLSGYRPLAAGYATADLDAARRFSSRLEAVLHVTNITDYYQNDFGADYAAAGRVSRVGLRLRW